jgi:hypothetical protein
MSGVTGIGYLVVFLAVDRMKLVVEEAEELEADVRVMEHEAFRSMSERE